MKYTYIIKYIESTTNTFQISHTKNLSKTESHKIYYTESTYNANFWNFTHTSHGIEPTYK